MNNAPVLAQADVGIAIGAGTDVAVETADVVLVKKDPADVSRSIVLARKVQGKIRQNLTGRRSTTCCHPVAAGALYPSPGPGQVLVKIGGAGVCHSDLHVMEEDLGFKPPFTLGHENAEWVAGL